MEEGSNDMKIAESLIDLIGNTPLVKINRLGEGIRANILAKIESFNPLSSVKDRLAWGVIRDAERKGILQPGKESLLVEPTSGNTGIGLAFICAIRGYRLILTMPDTMSIERRKLLSALGAELVLTEGSRGMKGAIEKAEEILQANPGAFMPQQFNNPANIEIHMETTAREIWEDTDGQVDVVVAGVGTGGTITGIARVLKERKPSVKIIAVEPLKSRVIAGEDPGPHKIQGIGAGFIPKNLDTDILDEVFPVDEVDAGKVARALAKKEGIFVGISSGAAMHAALEIGKREENSGKNIVVILPDTGERYLSTWLFED